MNFRGIRSSSCDPVDLHYTKALIKEADYLCVFLNSNTSYDDLTREGTNLIFDLMIKAFLYAQSCGKPIILFRDFKTELHFFWDQFISETIQYVSSTESVKTLVDNFKSMDLCITPSLEYKILVLCDTTTAQLNVKNLNISMYDIRSASDSMLSSLHKNNNDYYNDTTVAIFQKKDIVNKSAEFFSTEAAFFHLEQLREKKHEVYSNVQQNVWNDVR